MSEIGLNVGMDISNTKEYLDQSLIPSSHQQAFNNGDEVDTLTFDKSTPKVFLSKGAISCYFGLAFGDTTVNFKHLVVATIGKGNTFAKEYLKTVLDTHSSDHKVNITLIGTTSKREGLRSNDRMYQSTKHKNALLKVNDELESVLIDHGPNPPNITMNVIHVPLPEGWDSFAMTFGDNHAVIWDEQSEKAISMFSFEDLQKM